MRAIALQRLGSPVVEVDFPDPRPQSGEVVVRIEAAGICHSDAHYRSGERPVPQLPLVLGHEIAGTVVAVGEAVTSAAVGDRVALNYLVSCGSCERCEKGQEPFCATGSMLGFDRPGGYSEAVCVPERNVVLLPAKVGFPEAAVAMCSTATVYHALARGRFTRGESVLVVGAGGLGLSAIQLAMALGASDVTAVEPDSGRRQMAIDFGAETVEPGTPLPARYDVALELVGLQQTFRSAVDALAPGGRAVIVGIGAGEVLLAPFTDLVLHDREIIGSADHLLGDVREVLRMQAAGEIDVRRAITERIPFDAASINRVLDRLDAGGPGARSVIVPGS